MDVKTHTGKKHRALSYYFKICRDVLRSGVGPKGLYFIDLFCGDGISNDSATDKKWEASSVKLLEDAKVENLNVRAFFNDLDKQRVESLQTLLSTKGLDSLVDSYSSEDANARYKNILTQVPSNQWSLFYLDPTNYKDLHWSTIKDISQHAYNVGTYVRRPELIIHFSTYTLVQDYKARKYDDITTALGCDDWRDAIAAFKARRGQDAPVFSAFYEVFKKQLESLGYFIPSGRLPIKSTVQEAPLYYLIFATSSPIVFKKIEPMINRLSALEKDWQRENKGEVKRIQYEKKGYTKSIDQFCD